MQSPVKLVNDHVRDRHGGSKEQGASHPCFSLCVVAIIDDDDEDDYDWKRGNIIIIIVAVVVSRERLQTVSGRSFVSVLRTF